MSGISQKEVLRDSYDDISNDTSSPRGDQGEIIYDLGNAGKIKNWTVQTDSRRLLRQRFENQNGDPFFDYTVDVDSGEKIPTSYDIPQIK